MLRAEPKKRLGYMQRARIDTARERSPGGRYRQVIGAGKAGNGIQQDDNFLFMLYQTGARGPAPSRILSHDDPAFRQTWNR
jgi:hypothetical protein